MSIIQGNAHTSAGGGSFNVERSLRFNSADSAYLNRTPASAGNRRTWTWSGWIKRSNLGVTAPIFSGSGAATGTTAIRFETDNTINFYTFDGSYTSRINTTQVFRDVSSWYHIVGVFDTTSATSTLTGTSTDRVRLYVNGVQVSAFSATTVPTQNYQGFINSNVEHSFNARYSGSYVDINGTFYLTEVNFIDGQALTPSSFGETDSATGVWKPKAYSGTYGTNGFYLKFADNSNTTAATLGKDSSGNGNNWTPNNFSVTAGAGNDSMVDSPTSYGTDTGAGGTVRGNYCTLNPLNKNTSGTLSNGNLEWQASTTSVQVVTGTSTIIPSGKTYFELNVVTAAGSGTYIQVGIAPFGKSLTTAIGNASGNGYSIEQNQADDIQLRLNGTSVTVSTVVQTGDVLQVAVDHATGKLWFGRNNTWYNSSGGTTGNPGAGTNETATISTTADWFPAVAKYNTGGSYAINFGQRAFAYTAPSGFKALCTTNLPTPTIGATSTTQAGKYFNPVLYTGTGSTRTVTGVGFQPDFTWIKPRSSIDHHILYDAIRGVRKQIYTNLTNAEETETQGLSAFTSDGFTVNGAHTVRGQTNDNTVTYVAWNWNAGGSNATNTSGTITSTVRANTTSGFSIISYTGNKTSGATIGHGLGVAPAMVIIKERANASDWIIYHQSLGATKSIYFTTAAENTNSIWFNNTAPSSTVITLGNSDGTNRANTMIAYAFAPVAGYSAFGSYTGNGSADGPFVYTNFRPRFILWKRSDGAESWWINDTSRLGYNGANQALFPNASSAENTANNIDILSNGFKIRGSGGEVNASGGTYIYMALAESPFKFSLAR